MQNIVLIYVKPFESDTMDITQIFFLQKTLSQILNGILLLLTIFLIFKIPKKWNRLYTFILISIVYVLRILILIIPSIVMQNISMEPRKLLDYHYLLLLIILLTPLVIGWLIYLLWLKKMKSPES